MPAIAAILILIALAAVAQNSYIESFSTDGTLTWITAETNIYCGMEYTLNLTDLWSHEVGFHWNRYMTEHTNTAEVGIPEGLDRLFMRIVCSSNSFLGEPYDIETERVPIFVYDDYIDLDKIGRISKFRSGEGHDYSDDFESCRSMKHYYEPNITNWTDVGIFAPVDGTLYNIFDEGNGMQTWIRSSDYPAFFFILFHVELTNTLSLGDTLTAGEQIGHHYSTNTTSDIALGVNTPTGWQLLSFFEVMADGRFADYTNRGVNAQTDFIITESERDADPLTCNGEEFADPGNLTNWVVLD